MLLEAKVERIQKDMEDMAQYTATPGRGITRFSFTEEDRLTRAFLKDRMRACGLEVYEDAAGSIIGRRPGRADNAPVVMIGSHFDSVKNGGPFDGPAGVVTALEIARVLHENSIVTEHPIEFVALIEEEGGRFGSGLFGSRAMAGRIAPQDLYTCKDDCGVSMAEAMASFGFDPMNISQAARMQEQIKAFFELHIEQGPVLEATGVNVGIVEAVVGITQLEVVIEGRADHAGTTPMDMRSDALVAAAQAVTLVNQLAKKTGRNAVATVGKLSVMPGAYNIVPGKVVLTVDIRSAANETIKELSQKIKRGVLALPEQFPGISCSAAIKMQVEPVILPANIVTILEEVGLERGISTMHMVSGAGHDAMIMAGLTQVGLVFVPSRMGRSHCPEEWTEYRQLKQGVDILLGAVLRQAGA